MLSSVVFAIAGCLGRGSAVQVLGRQDFGEEDQLSNRSFLWLAASSGSKAQDQYNSRSIGL